MAVSFLYLVFLFLELAAAGAGLVIALVRRSQAPARAMLGALGLGLLAFSTLTTLLSSLSGRLLLSGDDSNYSAYTIISMVLSVVRLLAFAAGVIVLALALFRSENGTQPPQQQHGYPGAGYPQYGAPPQQPYQSPGYQSPPASPQWPQPGQQPPPGQPPPGQQPYPWQQPPPGQQYPGY